MLHPDFKLVLTMLMVPHYWYWLIENHSGFTNESRNAMVLTYDLISSFLFSFSEVIREIVHLSFLVFSLKEKKKTEESGAAGWIQPILEINNSHTLPFQKRSIHQALHLDLLDLLLKYRY